MKGKILTSWSLVWLLLTVLFVVGGIINLLTRASHSLPATDGIVWVQRGNEVFANQVEHGLAGDRAGIQAGDKLIGISLDDKKFDEIASPSDVQEYLETAGVDGNLTYFYQRPSYSFKDNFYYADLRHIDSFPRWTAGIVSLAFVGIVWLGVGLFVLFKQGGRSPFVLNFATICLAAFIFHVYKPLGLGEDLDLFISQIDDLAFALFAPLFVHFCVRYPVRSDVFSSPRWKTFVLYVPAALIWFANVVVSLGYYLSPDSNFAASLAAFADRFDAIRFLNGVNLFHFVAGLTIGSTILVWRFLRNPQMLVRQRLKWAMWGTVIAVVPIVAVQISRLFIDLPEDFFTTALTTLPLALIPLSFGHSVVRYRLMDVDVVVRRALVFAITTLAIAAMIGTVALGLIFLAIGENLSSSEIVLRGVIAIIAMAAIVLLSEPLRNFLQERADRFFYGERYDLRRGLLDFGKTISATTNLEPLLDDLVNRLQQVLNVEKVAVFVEEENAANGYRIARSVNLNADYEVARDFRQMIRLKSSAKGIVRADELDAEITDTQNLIRQELHYYVPCVVRGRMIAVIGLGRTRDGSLLSSEDLEILQTVSGYIAVAIDNSLLYQEQETRTHELNLLKEFNESIVESINVGLLAVDESGQVTRCNSTFEDMFGIRRDAAVGKFVDELFDERLASTLNKILGKTRWHLSELRHAYKIYTETANGEDLILNLAVAPLRSISSEQTGAIVVIENVTSRVKLEESLQHNEKLTSIGLLAAGVAHEVNTPLTGVSSYTQMLLGMIPVTDPKHSLLLKVQKQTERASNIANNLLNFSRAGNGTEFVETDVNKTLDDTLQLLEPQLRKSNIKVEKDYSPIPLIISGNAGKLQQVFTNLILNARDAITNGGTISLSSFKASDDTVAIIVKDDGKGIEPQNLSKIYDPFFTTKEVGSGTGLGLAVTFGIVQEHSGTIEATSELGKGTSFRLEFPEANKRRRRAVI